MWMQGTTLKFGPTGTDEADMREFLYIEKVDAGKLKRKGVKTSTLTSGKYSKQRPYSLIEQDAVKLKVQYRAETHAYILGLFEADDELDFLVTFPDGSKVLRSGFLSEMDLIPEADQEGNAINNVSIEFSGQPTFTPVDEIAADAYANSGDIE